MSPVGAGQRLTRSARYLPWVLTARAPSAEWRTTLQHRTPGPAWSGLGTIASRPPWGPGRAPARITSLAGTGREPRHLRDSVIQARPWPPLSAMALPRTALAVSGSPSVATSQRDSETPAQASREIRNSEERASQKPQPSSGRRRTGVALTRTNAGPAESSSPRYGPDPQPLHVSSILFTGLEGRGCIVHHLPLR